MNSVVHIGSNRRLSMTDELGRREEEVFRAYIRYLIFILHFKTVPDRGLPTILPLLSGTILSSECFIVQLNRNINNYRIS
jgi:hypothetical protein